MDIVVIIQIMLCPNIKKQIYTVSAPSGKPAHEIVALDLHYRFELTRIALVDITGQAKRAAQKCTGNEASEEADNEVSGSEDSNQDNKSNGESVEEKTKAEASNGNGAKDKGNRRVSQAVRQKLLAEVDLKFKLVDFGNACWT